MTSNEKPLAIDLLDPSRSTARAYTPQMVNRIEVSSKIVLAFVMGWCPECNHYHDDPGERLEWSTDGKALLREPKLFPTTTPRSTSPASA